MSEWREFKIKEVANVVAGGTPKTSIHEYWNGSISWITPKDLSNHKNKYISNGSRSITDLGLKKSAAKLLPPETILLTSRAPIGYMAIAENKITTNQGFKNIICDKNKVNNHFLYYYLLVNMDQIKGFASGATFPEISGKTLKNIRIQIPNIESQTKIADVLSTYDKLIENNNRRIQILEQTAEELYKEWFVRMRFPGYEKTKFDKGIPEGWEVKKVKGLVKRYRYGSLYKENDVMQEGNVIVIDQSEKDFLGFHNNEPDHFAGIDNPIILFGDHSCKMLIMTSPFSLSENVIPFNAENNLNTLFLFYAVRGLVHTTEYKRHWSDLTNKRILVPDYSLQQKFEAKVKSIIILINEYKKSNLNLIKQRDLLLPRLMNGTITVK